MDFARRLRTVTEPRQGHARQEKDENIHRQTSQWGAGSWVSPNVCLLVWYWFASDGNFAQGNVGYVLLLKKASCHKVRNPGFQFIPSSWISAENLPGQCFVGVYRVLKVCAACGIGYWDLIYFVLLSVFVVVSINPRGWLLSQPPLNRPEGLLDGLFTCLIFFVYLSIFVCLSLPPFLLIFFVYLSSFVCVSSSLPPSLFTPLSSLLFEFSRMCRKRSLYSTTNVLSIFESTHPKRLHSAVVCVYVCLMLEQCAHNYL